MNVPKIDFKNLFSSEQLSQNLEFSRDLEVVKNLELEEEQVFILNKQIEKLNDYKVSGETRKLLFYYCIDRVFSKMLKEQKLKINIDKEYQRLLKKLNSVLEINYQNLTEQNRLNYQQMLLIKAGSVRIFIGALTLVCLGLEKNKKKVSVDSKQAEIALYIYKPLASKFGFGQVSSDLGDLILYYQNPEAFKEIVGKLAQKKEERNQYNKKIIEQIEKLLQTRIECFTVAGRSKSIYSIYTKTTHMEKNYDDLFDFQAVRIICQNIADCYTALSQIQNEFEPLVERFKDYIVRPKENSYQSLHTTVVDQNEQKIEVQIRTEKMDQIAEQGVAAHFAYKEKTTGMTAGNSVNVDDDLEKGLLTDKIYTFTPNGMVVILNKKSSVIDFAYHIHAKIAEQMIGALVDQKIVKYDYLLTNGETVEIKVKKGFSAPNKQWLENSYSRHARRKIKIYLNRKKVDYEIIQMGVKQLKTAFNNKEISFDVVNNVKFQKRLVRKMNYLEFNQICIDLVDKKITLKAIEEELQETKNQQKPQLKLVKTEVKENKHNAGIQVADSLGLATKVSKCCYPVKGDPIVGVIKTGKCIMIHHKLCPNIEMLKQRIPVSWPTAGEQRWSTVITVWSDANSKIETTIINAFPIKKVLVEKITRKQKKNADNQEVTVIKCQVQNSDHAQEVINVLRQIRGVVKVERKIK